MIRLDSMLWLPSKCRLSLCCTDSLMIDLRRDTTRQALEFVGRCSWLDCTMMFRRRFTRRCWKYSATTPRGLQQFVTSTRWSIWSVCWRRRYDSIRRCRTSAGRWTRILRLVRIGFPHREMSSEWVSEKGGSTAKGLKVSAGDLPKSRSLYCLVKLPNKRHNREGDLDPTIPSRPSRIESACAALWKTRANFMGKRHPARMTSVRDFTQGLPLAIEHISISAWNSLLISLPLLLSFHPSFFPGGYKVPKGAFVALQIYFIHRDER